MIQLVFGVGFLVWGFYTIESRIQSLERNMELALKEIEIYLIETLPGFRESLGLPGTINYETHLRELRTWENNSVLASSDSGQGLAKYLERYDKVIDWGKRNIRSNITIQSDDLFAQREYLRRYAEDVLLKEHPDFYHLWVNILSRELREDPAEDRQAGF